MLPAFYSSSPRGEVVFLQCLHSLGSIGVGFVWSGGRNETVNGLGRVRRLITALWDSRELYAGAELDRSRWWTRVQRHGTLVALTYVCFACVSKYLLLLFLNRIWDSRFGPCGVCPVPLVEEEFNALKPLLPIMIIMAFLFRMCVLLF